MYVITTQINNYTVGKKEIHSTYKTYNEAVYNLTKIAYNHFFSWKYGIVYRMTKIIRVLITKKLVIERQPSKFTVNFSIDKQL
jgi:hypothetical protein